MQEFFLELRARGDVDYNAVYAKVSALAEVEEVEERRNSTVPIN